MTAIDPPPDTEAGPARHSGARLASSLGLSVVFVALTWLAQGLTPRTGLDPGWILGINLARQTALDHGVDIAFTYGPMGWLARPQAFDAPTMWGYLLFTSLTLGSLAFVLLYTLFARYTWWIGAIAVYALMAAAQPWFLTEVAMITAFAVAMLTLQGALGSRVARWIPFAIASVGGFLTTVKFGTGVITIAIAMGLAVVTSASLRTGVLRTLATGAAAFGVLVVAWIASGTNLSAMPSYISLSLDLASQYVEMATDTSERAWEYVVGIGLVITLGVAVWLYGPWRRPTLATWGWIVLLGAMTWHMFRYGFIRHDQHVLAFFWFLALVVLVIRWRSPALPLPAGAFLAALLLTAFVPNQPLLEPLNPTNNVRDLLSDLRLASSAEAREEALEQAREEVRGAYGASEDLLAALAGDPTHIDSYETTFAWAYDLVWTPAPIFQTYSAYSHDLDLVNAARLGDVDGPRKVLRRDESPIDGRYRLFESPEYTRSLVCDYSTQFHEGSWQVVERIAASRCGEPVSKGASLLSPGERISIPEASSPNAMVVAVIDVDWSLPYSLVRRVFKPPPTSIVLDDRQFRIVSNHLRGPLILSLPDWEELPARTLAADGSNVRSLAVEGDGISGLRVEFLEVVLDRTRGLRGTP